MHIIVRTDNEVTILDLSGRFDSHTAPQVTQALSNALTGTRQTLVSLAGVDFVDSTALATLVQAMKRHRQQGGELYLCGLRPPVYMIFELARLDQAFTIFADETHARRTLDNLRVTS